ncbi:hypothetical protein V1477_015301 [Vespula maculifrons]|uniref:Uncharacterized protein n=2 Tax=Vespula TaxID=7451 RepID=A0A834J8G4_VESVU|nr:hypothetical protein HZH66_012700 [Vespula vulgaris]
MDRHEHEIESSLVDGMYEKINMTPILLANNCDILCKNKGEKVQRIDWVIPEATDGQTKISEASSKVPVRRLALSREQADIPRIVKN